MPFLTQTDKNNCGAFCICYLHWLDSGRTPAGGPETDDQPTVDEIYDFVQMGDSAGAGDPPDYCDLVRMLALLQLNYKIDFYIDPTQQIADTVRTLHRDFGARDQAFMDLLESTGRLHEEPPPQPQIWTPPTSAIVVYDILDGAGTLRGRHAVLFRRGPGGEILRYNPWDGEAVAANSYAGFVSGDFMLVPSGSAILTT